MAVAKPKPNNNPKTKSTAPAPGSTAAERAERAARVERNRKADEAKAAAALKAKQAAAKAKAAAPKPVAKTNPAPAAPTIPAPAPTPAVPAPVSNTNVLDVLRKQYTDAGLPASFADIVFGYTQQGLTEEEADIRLRGTTEWKTRFAGNEQRKAKGMRELTPAEYLSKERALADQFAFYDLPTGFYDDPQDFAKAIAADLGADELGLRLKARKEVVEDGAMTGVLQQAQDYYGITLSPGELLAFWIDPDRATNVITKRAEAAKIGAAARRSSFGSVSAAEAERLASLGIGADQAQQGYGQAAQLLALTQSVGGDAGVAREDLTSAVFEDNADAQRRVQRAADTRKARFQGGGQYAQTKSGFGGLGSANS